MSAAAKFVNPDGSVVMIVFTHDDEDLIQRDLKNHLSGDTPSAVQPGASVVRFAKVEDLHAALPNDRRFRNCWKYDGAAQKTVVDLPSARAQVLSEIRVKRDSLLADSDKLLLRAQDQGNAAAVAKLQPYRQALRDLPATVQPQLDAINDPAVLGTFTPTYPVVPGN